MTKLIIGALLTFALGCSHSATCPPPGETLSSLTTLKTAGWKAAHLEAAPAREAFALALVDCLDSPNPELRDGLAFEGLQALMRGRRLEPEALQKLRTRLLAMLEDTSDPQGFRRPFAALVLADVVRADRIQPFMTARQRFQIADAAAAFVTNTNDYRGYDEREGWRHAVAHGSDLLMQLSLNPQLEKVQAPLILDAIATQVMPASGHVYRYGEGERLMAPVFYLSRRGWLSSDEWDKWLAALVARVPKETTPTQKGLAARQNLTGFLSALYLSVRESGSAEIEQALLPGLRNALKALG